MCKVAIVVLHYENLFDTKECLNSLLKYLTDDQTQIVVVDNGSVKEKLTEIEGDYKNSSIHFIYSKINLGFANGNNLGFTYAKYQLNADIIILANNDLVFKQTNFIEELVNAENSLHFDVAGPKIISLVDGRNQNPVPRIYRNLKDVKKRILKFRMLYILSLLNLDVRVQDKYRNRNVRMNSINNEDFQLHGACMIFANRYIRTFDGLCDKTFMYGEESILKYQCIKYNFKLCYLDQLVVFHKEGSTTNKILGSRINKRRFYYSNNIRGCRVLERLMKEDQRGM